MRFPCFVSKGTFVSFVILISLFSFRHSFHVFPVQCIMNATRVFKRCIMPCFIVPCSKYDEESRWNSFIIQCRWWYSEENHWWFFSYDKLQLSGWAQILHLALRLRGLKWGYLGDHFVEIWFICGCTRKGVDSIASSDSWSLMWLF